MSMKLQQLEGLAYLQGEDWQRNLWPLKDFQRDFSESTGPLLTISFGIKLADKPPRTSSEAVPARFFEVDSSGVATVRLVTGNGSLVSLNEHSAEQMTIRKVTLNDLDATMNQEPITYWQVNEKGIGAWQQGYYDPGSRTFVAVRKGEATTVMVNVSQNYVNGLGNRRP